MIHPSASDDARHVALAAVGVGCDWQAKARAYSSVRPCANIANGHADCSLLFRFGRERTRVRTGEVADMNDFAWNQRAKMALLTALALAPLAINPVADAAPNTSAAADARGPKVDPKAIEAVQRMTDYLKTLETFTLRGEPSATPG